MSSSNEVSQSQSSVPVEVEVNASGAHSPEHPATPTNEPPVANNSPAPREYEFHPFAELFPMLPDSELRQMARDIKAKGLQEPIWLYEGKILDGRNRYEACIIAGVRPTFRDYAGDNPAGFVFSVNFHRRHLSMSQRAAMAVEFLPSLAAEAKARQQKHGGTAPGRVANTGGTNTTSARSTESGKARDRAAKKVGVSPRYVSDAKKLQLEAPALLKAVQLGTKTLPTAMREIEKRNKASRPKAQSLRSKGGGNRTVASAADGSMVLVVVFRPGDGVLSDVFRPSGTDDGDAAQALSEVCVDLAKCRIKAKALPKDGAFHDALATLVAGHLSPATAAVASANPARAAEVLTDAEAAPQGDAQKAA